MIDFVRGLIVATAEGSLTLDVGALGLTCSVARIEGLELGTEATIYTYVHWNQEQGPSLFGFLTKHDRTIFELIITCNGVGPKIALAVLSTLSADEFITALVTENSKVLSSVNGIGMKKAEHLIFQLKDKVSKLPLSLTQHSGSEITEWITLGEALASLHYSKQEVSKAVSI